MVRGVPQDPLERLQDEQSDQTKLLRELQDKMIRVLTLVERWVEDDKEQDRRIDEHHSRLTSLEHDRTSTKTALKITWAVVGTAMGAVGYVLEWLLSR